jgi:DNA-binding response OmpR family regulator
LPSTSHILVVDDDPAIREAIATILTDNGFRTTVAIDGRQALRQIQNEKPDLIVLDRAMPGLSGDEVLLRMQQYCETTPPPVILISADRNNRPVDVPFLAKPFAYLRLLAEIEKLLPAKA